MKGPGTFVNVSVYVPKPAPLLLPLKTSTV